MSSGPGQGLDSVPGELGQPPSRGPSCSSSRSGGCRGVEWAEEGQGSQPVCNEPDPPALPCLPRETGWTRAGHSSQGTDMWVAPLGQPGKPPVLPRARDTEIQGGTGWEQRGCSLPPARLRGCSGFPAEGSALRPAQCLRGAAPVARGTSQPRAGPSASQEQAPHPVPTGAVPPHTHTSVHVESCLPTGTRALGREREAGQSH